MLLHVTFKHTMKLLRIASRSEIFSDLESKFGISLEDYNFYCFNDEFKDCFDFRSTYNDLIEDQATGTGKCIFELFLNIAILFYYDLQIQFCFSASKIFLSLVI